MSTENTARYLFAAARTLDDAHAILDMGGGTWAYGDKELGDLMAVALANGRLPVVENCGQVAAGSGHASR